MEIVRARLGVDPSDPPGWLDPDMTDLGQDLHLSDIHGCLGDIPGLSFAHVLAVHRADEPARRADRIAVAANALPVWSGRIGTQEALELLWEEAQDL